MVHEILTERFIAVIPRPSHLVHFLGVVFGFPPVLKSELFKGRRGMLKIKLKDLPFTCSTNNAFLNEEMCGFPIIEVFQCHFVVDD